MSRLLTGLLVCCVAAGMQAKANAAEPLDVIKKAIKAHGGKEKLKKYKAAIVEGKGTVNTQGMELKYEAKSQVHYPARYRVEISMNVMGMDITVLQVMNGKEGWLKVNDMKTMALPDAQLKAVKTQFLVDEAVRLLPLLDKKKYTLSSVGESKVKGKPAIGINITSKAGLDVNFYFDPKTYMIIKYEFQTVNETGKEVMQTSFLSGFKKFNGMVMPTKLNIQQDGKKFVTAEITKVEFKEKLEASLFEKPK